MSSEMGSPILMRFSPSDTQKMQMFIIEAFLENSAPFVSSGARRGGGINCLVIFTYSPWRSYPNFVENVRMDVRHLTSIS